MNRAHTMLYQEEKKLYDTCRHTWSMYTALKYAPKEKIKPLWDLLNPEQQKMIKRLR